MNTATQAYTQASISTVGQGELLLMLYDGAIKFLHQAKVKMAVKDYAQKGILISKSIDIINELAGSLNMEKGGSLAENLNNLYFFCTTHLLQANMRMDAGKIDAIIKILGDLRGAYSEIMEKPEAILASQQIAARLAPSASITKREPLNNQNPSIGLSGQLHGRSVYGQYAQKAANAQPQAIAEESNAMSAQQLESPVAAVEQMPIAANKIMAYQQNAQVKNTDVQLKSALKYEQNDATVQPAENASPQTFSSASMPVAEAQKELPCQIQRPLSGFGVKSSKRMALYGKVGQ